MKGILEQKQERQGKKGSFLVVTINGTQMSAFDQKAELLSKVPIGTELEYETKTNVVGDKTYTNVQSIELPSDIILEEPPARTTAPTPATTTGSGDTTARRIARQVALKAAVETSKDQPDLDLAAVLRLAEKYNEWLNQ